MSIRTVEDFFRRGGELMEREEIAALPAEKRAARARELLGGRQYKYGSKGYEQAMNIFWEHLLDAPVYTGEPRDAEVKG